MYTILVHNFMYEQLRDISISKYKYMNVLWLVLDFHAAAVHQARKASLVRFLERRKDRYRCWARCVSSKKKKKSKFIPSEWP